MPLLAIFVPLYLIGFYLLKHIKMKKQIRFVNKKIVCVGNHTLGGTGKTTIVKELVKELSLRGKNVGVVIRGYKRKGKKITLILDTTLKLDNKFVKYAGDEPFMLYRSLNVPIAISSNRVEAIKKLCQTNKVDIIISDDGYQNFTFYKDINILVINLYEYMYKNSFIFPLGRLRESLSSALSSAQYVVLNHVNFVKDEVINEVENKIKKVNKDIKVIKTYYKLKNFVNIYTNESLSVEQFIKLNSCDITVVCGIGEPVVFVKMLESNGLNIKYKFIYPDHYWYKNTNLNEWKKTGHSVVTTYKDAIKIYPLLETVKNTYKIYYCNIQLEIKEGKELWTTLINSL